MKQKRKENNLDEVVGGLLGGVLVVGEGGGSWVVLHSPRVWLGGWSFVFFVCFLFGLGGFLGFLFFWDANPS